MKKLNKKVFVTIFTILSIFLIFSLVIYNVQTYKKEYDSVYRNLTFVDDKNEPFEKKKPNNMVEPKNKDLDNMMIMDYEVYTIKLNNNKIDKIIKHSNNTSNFDVENIASNIIKKDNKLKIGNLYNNKYSYNYTSNDKIIIMNTKNINNKLITILIKSLILLLIIEILIYFISKLITKWITKPAYESFNKQKDFIADASHELKTPLAVIMASSDELVSDKKNSKYIENIKYESERMNKLIASLLDLSKLERNSKETYKEENISKIIEKICLTFEAIAFENNINIKTNIEDKIMFNCNKDDIEKLISIILDNAIKHSYKDSNIIINTKKIKNNIEIEIINSGDSINPGDEEKIFERFYRADKSRNRNDNRYGLGLAIAKSIVINHNGSIKAYSKNQKTTFKIIFKK